MSEENIPQPASRVAIVTGSGRGIGRIIALKLAEKNVAVVINDVGDPAPAQEVVSRITTGGGKAMHFMADISKADEVENLISTTVNAWQRVDILVNNAGITRDQLLMRMSEEDWDRVMTINVKGAFLCTRAAIRIMMRQRWGRIINISSVAGIIGNAGQANYSASKAGLIGLTKTTAREVASRGITVNAIAPGLIESEMTKKIPETNRAELIRQVPMGYMGTAEDVAGVAAFLASEEARYITGQVIRVDGGLVMA